MKQIVAFYLRRIAQWLDPQEATIYIELHEVDGAEAGRLISQHYGQRGFPVFWWRIGNNGFRVWPELDGRYQLAVRTVTKAQ